MFVEWRKNFKMVESIWPNCCVLSPHLTPWASAPTPSAFFHPRFTFCTIRVTFLRVNPGALFSLFCLLMPREHNSSYFLCQARTSIYIAYIFCIPATPTSSVNSLVNHKSLKSKCYVFLFNYEFSNLHRAHSSLDKVDDQ